MIVGLLLIASGAAAGLFGSLLGLGGGVLLVPILALGFDLPLREAVGVSLIAVIMTSSASAGVYLERRVADLRLGMSLELFTAIGALVGASVAYLLDEQVLELAFAVLLAYVAVTMVRGGRPGMETEPADAPDEPPPEGYRVRRYGLGIVGSLGAGLASALLGIGGGVVKVPLMHLAMGVPLRVAIATSNLMVGITAAASAVIYLSRGGIDPYVAGPTAIGVFLGASVGSRAAHRVDLRLLRLLFVAVLGFTAIQMVLEALS